MKILLEYKDKSFSSLIDLDRVIISFKEEVFSKIKNNLSNKKILHIKLINDNFSFSIEDIWDNNKDIKLTNEFEIATIKGDKKLHKIINIKSYFKIMENSLDPDYASDLMTKVNNYEKEIELLKKAIEDHENKINLLNTEIERLKKIESENNKIRGRFVFKGFIDYVFLLFDIEINKKYEEKYELLKENVKKNKINFRDVFFMIQKIRQIYKSETNIAYKEYTLNEIKIIILDHFIESDYIFMEKFFEKLKPEKVIQFLMKKNNELTLLMMNNDTKEEEKKKQRDEINKEINKSLSTEDKKDLISYLIELIEEYNKI